MSQHQTDFTMEKAFPAAEAAPGLKLPQEPALPVSAVPIDRSEPARRRRLRPLLLAAVAVAALAGAADCGWRYWTMGRFEVATDTDVIE